MRYKSAVASPATLQVDTFIREIVLGRDAPQALSDRPSVWHHMMSWYPVRCDSNVLWLHYEDIVAVRLIAARQTLVDLAW